MNTLITADFLLNALSKPPSALGYYVTSELVKLFPNRHIYMAGSCSFDLECYEDETGLCATRTVAEVPNEVRASWRSPKHPCYRSLVNGYSLVEWRGRQLEVLRLTWKQNAYSTSNYAWIVSETEEQAKAFYREVCAYCSEIRGEVLVFEEGHWSKDRELYQDISGCSKDSLVLAGDLKSEIWSDFERFFQSREMYQRYGIPWKRGVLFLGPPGNGKSHAVRALINDLQVDCLYVKSLKSQYDTEHSNIRSVFQRARDSAPCVLVFEDLDSHIHEQNRSFFLNELDGFAANEGILTLATSNYPERLDPSILERPSRFDRKYSFRLPSLSERVSYLALWEQKLEENLRLEESRREEIARLADGYSFAYLKELILSSMMTWINEPAPMHQLMLRQIENLRMQMQREPEANPPEDA